MGRYLDIAKRVERESTGYALNALNAERGVPAPEQTRDGDLMRLTRLTRILATLEARCPNFVPADRWRQAVSDGKTFLTRWGDQARALGWTARDLLGLIAVPQHAKPTFNRLSRYDEIGLIWLLQGRPVVALTEAAAAIQGSTGAITIYRRHNKPALGPLGDSLDDLQ